MFRKWEQFKRCLTALWKSKNLEDLNLTPEKFPKLGNMKYS